MTDDPGTCPDCGDPIAADPQFGGPHRCDEQRRAEHQARIALAETTEFEAQLAAFLASPRGRFERYYAERNRRAA